MSAGMPELGSKISLISKADIRYEGRLFTVDPQECTIALANGKFVKQKSGEILKSLHRVLLFSPSLSPSSKKGLTQLFIRTIRVVKCE